MLLVVPGRGGPPLRFATTTAARLRSAPRLGLFDDLKYQLSNADEGSRPARDLVENPIALAYLLVLAAMAGGLAWLALQDSRNAARREASLLEMQDAAEMLREQGKLEEAAELERDLGLQRQPKEPTKPKPRGLAADPYGMDEDGGNRFERRQGRAARKAKKDKKTKRRKTR